MGSRKTKQQLSTVTDYIGFESFCHGLMSRCGYQNILPLGGFKDKGRDAIHINREQNKVTIFCYSVRKDWEKKLKNDLEKIKDHRHKCDDVVFITTARVTASQLDKWKENVKNDYGWNLDIYDLERVSTLVDVQFPDLKEIYRSIFEEEKPALLLCFTRPHLLQRNFTDRISERKMLSDWLSKDSHPVASLIAMGGMGKSALAWYWLNKDVIEQKDTIGRRIALEGIFWWSFCDKDVTLEKFLNDAIVCVSKREKDPSKEESTDEKIAILYNLLFQKKYLLVLDGFEQVLRGYSKRGSPYQGNKIDKDEGDKFRECIDTRLGTLLQMLAAGCPASKILITSRFQPKELDNLEGYRRIGLTGLVCEDSVKFFLKQGVRGSEHEIKSVCKACGFLPLALRVISGTLVEDPEYKRDIKYANELSVLRLTENLKELKKTLEFAYSRLPKDYQLCMKQIACFRYPVGFTELYSIFGEKSKKGLFKKQLHDLKNRELLMVSPDYTYDLHPIIREYCYSKLKREEKKIIHNRIRKYYKKLVDPRILKTTQNQELIKDMGIIAVRPQDIGTRSLEDLQPLIELYHHTIGSERYDEAYDLFMNKLNYISYYGLGEYNLRIELMSAFFPEGLHNPSTLQNLTQEAIILNGLANSYSFAGEPHYAISLYKKSNKIDRKQGNRKGLAYGLGNLAQVQIAVGNLADAETSLQSQIAICQEIEDELGEAAGHQELGRLLAYCGKYEESANELKESTEYWKKHRHIQGLQVDESYRSLLELLKGDQIEALNAARRAYDNAEIYPYEADMTYTEWLLGAAYLANEKLKEAEKAIYAALRRCRKINIIEVKPDILLVIAKLQLKRGQKEKSLESSAEALQIADRCKYRLQQADIHNFLAELYLGARNCEKAKYHAEEAKKFAWCDGPPHRYESAYTFSTNLVRKI